MSNFKTQFTILLIMCTASWTTLYAQFEVLITITGGTATTTCGDVFSPPDPQFSVNIGNTGWVTYPPDGSCYTDFPNTQWQQSFNCLSDVPPNIEICFRAFENDPNPFVPCDVNESCLEEICGTFPLPPFGGGNFTLALPAGGASEGEVQFAITNQGFPGGINDMICAALDLGSFGLFDTLGFADLSVFSNYCGTNTGEPNPSDDGANWNNDGGTWYSFTTGNIVGSAVGVLANSDPQNTGDPVNLQLAIYASDNGSCGGNLTLVGESYTPADFDEIALAPCLQPNTTYWVMVDGSSDTPDEQYGVFGMEIIDYHSTEAPDLPCGALSLGAVPDNDFVQDTMLSNFCATAVGDPVVSGFGTQSSVWFTFTPPATGHVQIDARGNMSTPFPLDMQMAVFESASGNCFGPFVQVSDGVDPAGMDASIELSCLDPNKTYYIMIDGTANQFSRGIFDIRVTGLPDDTPVFDQTVVLCAGESIQVGTSTYDQTGMYSDLITLPNGCDSIVNTDLTVLPPLLIDLTIDQQANGMGGTDGQATASATGGQTPFAFEWSDGQTTGTATGLVGGDNYCVTVTDAEGCQDDTCFVMPFIVNFVPTVNGDSLSCNGDTDGTIEISAFAGQPPYSFMWEKDDLSLNGNGNIPNENEVVTINFLPAGTYHVSISDNIFDTTLTVEIWEPEALNLVLVNKQDPGCFGDSDGFLVVSPSGGTPPYSYNWSNMGTTDSLPNLSAGLYSVTLSDANNCPAAFSFTLDDPPLFTATVFEQKPVSCIGDADGIIAVNTNGTPASFLWSTLDTTAVVQNLPAGAYSVTVTNTDGCTATASGQISEPATPVTVQINEILGVSCAGQSDGMLEAVATGPGNSFTYAWSPPNAGSTFDGAGAGTYSVTVTNDLGCTAEAAISITDPAPMNITASATGESCADGSNGGNGSIFVENVTGGTSPYVYSIDGNTYSPNPLIPDLTGGTYTLFVQDSRGCESSTTVTLEGVPNLSFDLGDDMEVVLGDSVTLDATPSFTDLNGLTYQWEPAALFPCQNCAVNGFYPTNNTSVTVTVMDETSNCRFTDDITILVNKIRRVYIPNIFSPNDDGINDYFAIYGGTDVEIVTTLKIFDRYGGLVFEAQNFIPEGNAARWDGRAKGEELNPGVFVYFAEVRFRDGETAIYRGDVTLIK